MHEDLPGSYGADAPAYFSTLTPEEQAESTLLSSDQCIVGDKHFFIRGLLTIPIVDSEETFDWLVWVSLSQDNFARTSELWETVGRESQPSYFGWLNSVLPGYPETLNLKTSVHTRPVGERPWIELEPTDHPLAVEQHQGISQARAQQLHEMLLHGHA